MTKIEHKFGQLNSVLYDTLLCSNHIKKIYVTMCFFSWPIKLAMYIGHEKTPTPTCSGVSTI